MGGGLLPFAFLVLAQQALHAFQACWGGDGLARGSSSQGRNDLVNPVGVVATDRLLDGLCDDLGRQVRCACGGGSRRAALGAVAPPGEMAHRIGDLACQVLHSRTGHAFEPRAALIRQPLGTVEQLDAVGTASWVDGRQAAPRAVSALDEAIPSPLRIAVDIGLRRQGSGKRRRIDHAVVVGHQEQGIAGRRILDLRQRCGREPLVEPASGDLQLEQVALVVAVKLQSGRAGQHLTGLREHGRLGQLGEWIDGPRKLKVPGHARAGSDLHDARAHQHARLRGAAAADLAHRLRIGLRVELVDQGHASAGLHVGDSVQAQGSCAQLSDPVALAGREKRAITPQQVGIDLARATPGVDLPAGDQPLARVDRHHGHAVFVQLPAVPRAFGPPEVQQLLEGIAPTLAMALGQPGDGYAGRIFVIARAQWMNVHG